MRIRKTYLDKSIRYSLKYRYSLLFLISLIIIILIVPIYTGSKDSVCFDEKCFDVEIADNQETREEGLMHIQDLSEDEGMLFIFEQEGHYSFWMKNTLIELDIIWIDSGRNVVHINEEAQPCTEGPCSSISSARPAKYVLEINGGLVEKNGIDVGDEVEFFLRRED